MKSPSNLQYLFDFKLFAVNLFLSSPMTAGATDIQINRAWSKLCHREEGFQRDLFELSYFL